MPVVDVLRRAVAVVCALALIAVGVLHSAHHIIEPPVPVTVQADVGPTDDAPDQSKRTSAAVGHCHGCMMVATTVLAPSIEPDRIATDLSTAKSHDRRPHIPPAETPPPIVAI